jgi:hypothetical protein
MVRFGMGEKPVGSIQTVVELGTLVGDTLIGVQDPVVMLNGLPCALTYADE